MKLSTKRSAKTEQALSDAAYETHAAVHEVRSQPMGVLMTSLRNRETRSRDFQVCTDRASRYEDAGHASLTSLSTISIQVTHSRCILLPRRLLLEETLARVPMREVDIVTPYEYECEGVVADKPSCGISISEDGFALLQVFRQIQPTSPTGCITLSGLEGRGSEPRLQKVCAPPGLRAYNVLLMDATCVTGASACVAIQTLLDLGSRESSIYFVCLLASTVAVSEICSRFPEVRIVTGGVDSEVNEMHEICPGLGNFTERYFNTTVVHHTSVEASVDL